MVHTSDDLSVKPLSQSDAVVADHQPSTDLLKDQEIHTVPSASIAHRTPNSTKSQDYINALLEFLSNASNETLVACVVGLGASTYFVLGRVGLVLIGILAGVVLQATWQYSGQSPKDQHAKAIELKRRHEVGLDIVSRVLDWRHTGSNLHDGDRPGMPSDLERSAQTQLDYSSFSPATGAALENITEAIIRDYVKWWYSPLLPLEQSFPVSCRQILINFITSFSSHLSRKRPADTFVDFLTNTSSIIIVFINELSSALMVSGAHNSEYADAIHRYLEQNPDCHLSNVLDVEQQQRKLEAVAEDILHSFLDPSAFNCPPVKAFLREVLAGLVLEMTVQSCSKPEFINGWVIYLLEEADSEIIDIIDAGVGGVTANGAESSVKSSSSKRVGSGRDLDDAQVRSDPTKEHNRTVSRAEDATEEAIQEARRLTELIAAEEAKRSQVTPTLELNPCEETMQNDSSDATTPNGPTPSSSASDLATSLYYVEDGTRCHSSPSAEPTATTGFTSFDQILPANKATALQDGGPISAPAIPPLTLHNATVSIFDDAQPGEKSTLRSKPQADYLIQIEPSTPQHPGWMIARKYPDFETLHEVLRRISVVSGVPAFAQRHPSIPGWKNQTKAALRTELERYIRDALSFSRLAESEGMKRFLEKDQIPGGATSGGNKGGFGFPSPAAFESMGKGMLDVLASTPKGAATGGKAILGGFTGVVGGLGSIGQKKSSSISPSRETNGSVSRPSPFTRMESYGSSNGDRLVPRISQDSKHDSLDSPHAFESSKPSDPSLQRLDEGVERPKAAAQYATDSTIDNSSLPPNTENRVPEQLELHLPPPPSEMPDEYDSFGRPLQPPEFAGEHLGPEPTSTAQSINIPPSPQTGVPNLAPNKALRAKAQPLSEPETRVAVELFFALINELYTLSSAWNIRRTLLNAAKSYLLRPGNPSLISIQELLQSSLDTNTSDEGIAAHLAKLRENSLPTEEELKKWPTPPNDEEKERLRATARKLLVEKGMPAALKSVMGAAASGEALGRIFDSLQVESVARGFMFAIILQGIKAVAQ